MRVSREQAAQNRQKIIEVAARRFRDKGVDGIGVADVMKEAGFTHGGFYNHFQSKEALAAEACGEAMGETCAFLRERLAEISLAEYVRAYLGKENRADRTGCAMAALAGDAWRQGPEMQAAFAAGLEEVVATVQGQLGGKRARKQALRLLSEMVGALVLSRAVPDQAGEEILAASRDGLT